MLPVPNPSAALREDRPWFGLGAGVALVALEACVLVAAFAPQIRTLVGHVIRFVGLDRTQVLVLAAVAAAYLLWHLRCHLGAYRSARLSPGLLALNALALVALIAGLAGISSGAAVALGGEPVARRVTTGLAVAWGASILALLAPRREYLPPIAGTLGFLAAAAVAASRLGRIAESFWDATGGTTVTMVEWLLRPLAGDEVICPEPFVVGTEAFRVFIGAPCSGYQGIGLISGLLVGYLWWFRRIHRFPQSLLLIPLGVALSWLANSVRIAALILVGIWISPEIAVEGFHAQAGWIAFLVVGLGIIWAAQSIPFFTLPPDQADAASAGPSASPAASHARAVGAAHGPSAAACLLPFLALTGATILTGAFTGGFDVLYPVRVIAVAVTLLLLRGHFPLEPRPGPLVSSGAIGIGVGVFLVWMALARDTATPERLLAMDPTVLGEPRATLWLLFRALGSVITVPIAEELAFRGFLIRRCIDVDIERVPLGTFTWLSFLVSSVAFGVLHGGAWIAGTLAGMAFAAALFQRRRMADAIAAHATTNALLSAYVIGTGTWTAWG